jgi:hypothetical protein
MGEWRSSGAKNAEVRLDCKVWKNMPMTNLACSKRTQNYIRHLQSQGIKQTNKTLFKTLKLHFHLPHSCLIDSETRLDVGM